MQFPQPLTLALSPSDGERKSFFSVMNPKTEVDRRADVPAGPASVSGIKTAQWCEPHGGERNLSLSPSIGERAGVRGGFNGMVAAEPFAGDSW